MGIPCVNLSSQSPPLEGIWHIRCPHYLMPLILLRRDNGAAMTPTGFCPPHNWPPEVTTEIISPVPEPTAQVCWGQPWVIILGPPSGHPEGVAQTSTETPLREAEVRTQLTHY